MYNEIRKILIGIIEYGIDVYGSGDTSIVESNNYAE